MAKRIVNGPGPHDHADNRGVYVELWVLDLLEGDQPSALLLSQLLWWHQPSKNGQPKLHYERDGHRWLVRSDDEWHQDCRLTRKQVRRARSVLVGMGLVEHRRFKRQGAPTSAWRPIPSAIAAATASPISPQPEVPSEGHFHGSDPAGRNGSDPPEAVPKSFKTERGKNGKEVSPDIDRLCSLLADLIEANGCKRPPVTDGWRWDCDKLMRLDGRSPDEIEAIIRWSQGDHFWRQNIMSMASLRKQFDRLRLASQPSPSAQPAGLAAFEEYKRRRAAR